MNQNPRGLLLNKALIRECEQAAFHAGITESDLREKAAASVMAEIEAAYNVQPIQVVCGPGKNGIDGLLIADLLKQKGWPVNVLLLNDQNFDASKVVIIQQGIIVDALFGIGLNRPLVGIYEWIVRCINDSPAQVVSVDIPSGVDSDTGEILGVAVAAHITVTFGFKKMGQLLPGKTCCGRIVCHDIGLQPPLQHEIYINHPSLWSSFYSFPDAYSHKYNRGFLCILGGRDMCGAALLSAAASRRVGVGLVQIESVPEGLGVYKQHSLGILTKPVLSAFEFAADSRYTTALIGPGSGRNEFTREAVLSWLAQKKTCVLDADALHVFKDDPQTLFDHLHDQVVLTPHEGEFSSLFKVNGTKIQKVQYAAKLSGAIVLLKGADTVIAHPLGLTIVQEETCYDLASGGTGDVLAGIIAGLLAGKMSPLAAAAMGVYIHVRAAQQIGFGLLAEDIPDRLPDIMKEFRTSD